MRMSCQGDLSHKLSAAFVVFAFLAGYSESSFAQDNNEAQPQAEVSQSRVHPLAGYFTEAGLLSCVVRADQIGTFLGGRGTGQSFVVMQASQNPTMVHVSLFVPSDEAPKSADIFFAPGLANCPASYTVSTVIDANCSDVVEDDPEKDKFVQIGESGHFFSEIGRGASIRLSPSGSRCVRVKSEVVE